MKHNERQILGALIRRCRKAANMSQQQLADRIGRAQSVVSSYESGAWAPEANMLGRIAATLGVSVDEMTRTAGVYAAVEAATEQALDEALTLTPVMASTPSQSTPQATR